MANWAVVIGINKYWTPPACLAGAVNDALAMRRWLLDPSGGNVPSANLKLLLAPLPGRRPRNVQWTEATSDAMLTEIADLMQRSGGQGEQFYFFYAGHGITARVSNSDETTIVGTDFSDLLTQNSCTLSSLTEFFETTEFQNQFFFIDACRNIPWRGEIVPGRWTQPQPRDPGLPPVQQFTFFATSPGSEAHEAADERGAFTKLLMKGLQGDGAAKAWAPEGDEYVVRWDRLVRYVGDAFERLDLPATGGYQRPQEVVARGAAQQDPVLSRFAPGTFSDLRLTVQLRPGAVGAAAKVTVIDEYEEVDAQPTRRGDALTYVLPPKTYGVIARADAHAPAKCRPPVDLYVPRRVTLELEPAAAGAPPPPAPPPPAPRPPAPPPPARATPAAANGAPAAGADADAEPAPARAAAPATAELTVSCSDAFAPIEVADQTGKVLAVGHSGARGVRVPDLPGGFYRARVRSPEGDAQETVVELEPGEHQHTAVDAPPERVSAVVNELVQKAHLSLRPDNTLEASESVGPIASPHLSTILTLAGGLAVRRDPPNPGEPLGDLGLRALDGVGRDAGSAVYVLLGVDSDAPARAAQLLESVKLRLWHMGTPIPDRALDVSAAPRLRGVGEVAHEGAPGAYWLSLEVPDEPPLVLALALLPQRVTMIVVQRDPTGLFTVYQYMPALQRDPSSEPTQLRRLELMQRCFAGGRLDLGRENAIELLRGKWADPIAGCLGGYLMLKLGKAGELGTAARNMVRTYPELSDSYLLEAEFHAAEGHPDAAENSAAKAFDAGLPIFADGISRLLDYPGSFFITNPNAKLASHVLDNRVKGALWSLWAPPTFTPGKLLVP